MLPATVCHSRVTNGRKCATPPHRHHVTQQAKQRARCLRYFLPGSRHMQTLEHRKQLDGLRFFAVLGVFMVHSDVTRFWWGSYGVSLFFVISGFLITDRKSVV